MKYIKPFQSFLNEKIEIGRQLFGGQFTGPRNRAVDQKWDDWLEKIYKQDYEPNTDDENEILRQLQIYFDADMGKLEKGNLDKLLPQLLKLKKKFPKILDPTVSNTKTLSTFVDRLGKQYAGMAWRGATVSTKDVEGLLPKSRWVDMGMNPVVVIDKPNITHTPRGNYGFISFSSNIDNARGFGQTQSQDRISVLYGVKLTTPNLIFNNTLTNTLSKFEENEVLLVGKSFKPDVIVIVDFRFTMNVYDDLEEVSPKDGYDQWKMNPNLDFSDLA
jgi:hypothetical protein